MGVLTKSIRDSLRNLVANLGTPRDKAAGSQYVVPLLRDDEAMNAYRGTWLARKIVDIPAKDACRKWRSWNAEGDEISKLEAEEKRIGVQAKVLDAMTKARLFGGAAIYIGTGDQNPIEELKPERINAGGIRHLNVLTKRILTPGEIETDPESPQYGKPKHYTINSQIAGQVDIHPSRLVVFTGKEQPDPELTMGIEQGWGDSILLSLMDALKQADSTTANIASLVFEAKIDVIKIPGFMQGLAGGGEYETQILNRLSLAATAKGINGALILDAEEDYQNKQVQFTQLPEIVQTFLQIVSGAADIPVTRLLGVSPGGLNSTGESDLRNYYDHIQSEQELVVQPAMAVLDECLIRSALGKRPPELWYSWRSLWQSTDKERADIGKTTAETIKLIDDTGLLPDEVMQKVATNMLTEAGIVPGLESEMEEWLKENPDGFVREEETPDSEAGVLPEATGVRGVVADATPRPLYVYRKVTNAAEILAWAKEQGFATTLPADDMHVTIAYSRQPVDWMKAGTDWAQKADGTLIVEPGGARLIEQFDGGAVVLLFNSSALSSRHYWIKEAGASWDYPDYQPHITITYDAGDVDLASVKPYRGAIELGPEVFEALDESWKTRIREE